MQRRAVPPHSFACRCTLALLLIAPLFARAQSAVDGALSGRLAPRIAVILRSVEQPKETRTVTTAADGSFLLLRLPPGEYVLEAGGLRREVSIEAGSVTALTEPTGLPVGEPSFDDLAQTIPEADEALTPEASTTDNGDPAPPTQNTRRDRVPLLIFRGLAPTQNATLLDGLSANQLFRSGPRGGSVAGPRQASAFAQSATRMLRVAPHNYSAQYGGAASGLLSATTHVATDAPHGMASYLAERSAWNAANPFSIVTHYNNGSITNTLAKPADTLNAGSARLGFGLRRAHHIFASLDVRHRNNPAIASPSEAAFYALTPVQLALLGTRGVPATATTAALNYLDSLTGEVPRTSTQLSPFARFDWKPARRDTLTLSGLLSHFASPAGSGGGPSTAVIARGRASVGDQHLTVTSGAARWLRLWSWRFNTEVRAQLSRDLEFETPRAPLAQEPGISPGGFSPQVSIRNGTTGAFRYGTPSSLGRSAYPDERRVQIAALVQYAPTHHLITLGGDWSRIHERIASLANTAGTFTYDSAARNGRAGGLVDWITDTTFSVNAYPNGGCPAIYATVHYFCFQSFTQSFGQQQTEFNVHTVAAFAQDLWRLTPSLTMELGVRYEYTLLPFPQHPNAALDALFGARGSSSIFPEDRNNVGPRLSVAWSPRESHWGTARLGYGMYYGGIPGGRIRSAITNTALPGTAEHIRIHPNTVTPCPQDTTQGFGFPCAFVTAPPAVVAVTTSAALFARNFRLPMVQQAELSYDMALGRSLSFRATYSMANAVQLSNSSDINIAPSTTLATFQLQGGTGLAGVRSGERFVLPVYTARISNNFGPVTLLTSNANATWHGLTTEATLRRSALTLHAAYTFSRAIDYGPEQGAIPRTNSQFDPFTIAYDKGLSDLSFPHRLAATLNWAPVPRVSGRVLAAALKDWRLSVLTSAASGRPYSYEIYGGDELSGGSLSINGSGGSAWLPTVGRNTLRLPVRLNTDARLARSFRVTQALRGVAAMEASNLFNRQNASTANTRAFLVGDTVNGITPLVFQNAATVAAEGLSTPPFGSITSSTTGLAHERTLQVSLRVTF